MFNKGGFMKTDFKEKLWWNKKKFKAVENILNEEFKDYPQGRGFCHIYWTRKKQLLKEIYNIDWKTPAELNPGTKFD